VGVHLHRVVEGNMGRVMSKNPIKSFRWAVFDVHTKKIIALFDSMNKAELASKPLGRIFGKYESSGDVDIIRMFDEWYK
jgi:hypothetical protein